MTSVLCGAEAVVRRGGPVQVPLQPCCIAALLRASASAPPLSCPFSLDNPAPVLAEATGRSER
jgi:hypothetical protein